MSWLKERYDWYNSSLTAPGLIRITSLYIHIFSWKDNFLSCWVTSALVRVTRWGDKPIKALMLQKLEWGRTYITTLLQPLVKNHYRTRNQHRIVSKGRDAIWRKKSMEVFTNHLVYALLDQCIVNTKVLNINEL